MKSIKRALKSLALCSIICITFTAPTFGNTKSNKDATIQIYEQPTGLYKPGSSETMRFVIKNNTNKKMTVRKIYIIEKSRENGFNLGKAFEEMAKYTTITIKEEGNEENQVSVKLKDILGKDNGVNLDKSISINCNREKEFILTIDMDEEMNNDAQGLLKIFSLGVVYNLSSGGGGGGGGTNPEPPVDPGNPNPPIDPKPPVDPGNPNPPIDPEPPVDPGNPNPPIDPEPPVGPENPNPPVDPDNPNLPIDPGKLNKPGNVNNGSNVGGLGGKLPQTGSIVNATSLIALGAGVLGLGIFLDRKSSSKGDDIDE